MVADMALHRHLVDLEALRAYAQTRAGRPGVKALRRVVELAEPSAESPMETRLRLLLQLAGLPRPLAQVDLHDDHGRFLARADLYYPRRRLVIEYDGGSHRERLVGDDRRQNRILQAGYHLLRLTAPDLVGDPAPAVAVVRHALARP